MDTDHTYKSVDAYIADLLTLHDNRFLAQQNAVKSKEDCYYQMAVQAILRMVSYSYLDQAFRQGPFYMQFTDLHQGNMIVDDNWNITSLIDLEWICARSPQMIDIPHWITSRSIDEIADPAENLHNEYTEARESFLSLFKDEECKTFSDMHLSRTMESAYSSGATWFFHSLDSPNAMYRLFELQLRPQFIPGPLEYAVGGYFAAFWSRDAKDITKKKLQDMEAYKMRLRDMFQVGTGEADGDS